MNKELKFSMKFDTGDFDRAVEKMQQKLKEIANLAKGGGQQPGAQGAAMPGGVGASGPMMPQFLKNMEDLRKNQNASIANHSKEQMKMAKDLFKEEERRNQLLVAQEKIAKNKNKDLAEELRIKKDLKNTEEQIARLQNESGRSKATFDASRNAARGGTQAVFVVNPEDFPGGGNSRGSKGGGGGGGGGGGSPFMKGMGKSLGMAGAILSAVGAVMDQSSLQPLVRNAATGNATQSILGNQLQQFAQGDVISGMAWQQERLKAMQMAQSRLDTKQATAPMNFLSGVVKKGGSLIGLGSGTDESSNYASGVITKALEKVFDVGGLIPNKLSKALGKQSEEYFSTQQAQLMEDFGKNYESMLDAQQKQNPLKNLAVNYFQDRYKADLQSERMLGMSDKQFYGARGFMEQANRAGFTGDMAIQQAQAIQAAGGSTRGMQGNSLLSLQAQRGFNLTNAAGVLGTISGGAGSSEASERIFKRIIKEGMKDGLDASDSVEELRRFSQMTAEVVSKTGATTDADVNRIIENFDRFQGGKGTTIREQEGAKAAYQEYQAFSSEAGGRRGALQYAAMTKQGLGGKLDPRAFGAIMEMPEEDITESNQRIVTAAVHAGIPPSAMRDKILAAKREMADVDIGVDPMWRKTLQAAGVKGGEELTEQQQAALSPEAQEAYYNLTFASAQRGTYGSAQKAAAAARGVRGGAAATEEGPMTAADAAAEATYQERITKGVPGERAADAATAAAGTAAQAMLENFREFKDVITPASGAVDNLTKSLVLFLQVASMTPDKDKAATLQGLSRQLSDKMNAQQAGKPPPGGHQ